VALNLSDAAVAIDAGGTLLLSTDGEPFDGSLAPWTGVVLGD
jgi:hypothetical protein